jgi:predicted nucleic acid-binding protein
MIGDKLTKHQPLVQPGRSQRDVLKAQEAIYEFLLGIVKTWSPDDVLQEFRHLFIYHTNSISSNTLPYLYEIVFSNQEQEFRNTIKRSCYILINNWDIARSHQSIQDLIHLFSDPILFRSTISPTLKRLREWLRNFVASSDFQELKLFAARYDDHGKSHWSQRYASYLLVPQYVNLQNPLEQRQAARNLSKQLKEKFKFDLAMYTALSQCAASKARKPANPTGLGDEVLRLIKRIVAKRGFFSYPNLARIFLNQTKSLSYREFKRSLSKYLIFSVEHHELASAIKSQLSEKFSTLYSDHDHEMVNDALLLRTCNRVIEYLTTEDHEKPSSLFVLLLSQGNSLTLVIILLKVILICRYSRTHLEARIADLILHYEDYLEEECQAVIHFFEIFSITMAIYAENTEYNLVHMPNSYSPDHLKADSEAYRIFSQSRQPTLSHDKSNMPE